MQTIAVIDYGMGNLRSVSKALESVSSDARVIVTSDASTILDADRVVCPGQGAARDCMEAIISAGLDSVISTCVASKPFLGICMGMQVLLTRSDENGGVGCLDIIRGEVRRFSDPLTSAEGGRLKVPHMGWNRVAQQKAHPLWQGISDHSRFYFAHSYYIDPNDSAYVLASSEYGHEFAVAVGTGAVFACQFHPEKSAESGLQLLRNFTQWKGSD